MTTAKGVQHCAIAIPCAFSGIQERTSQWRSIGCLLLAQEKDSNGSFPAGYAPNQVAGRQPLGIPLQQPRQTPQHCQVRGVVHVEAEPAA